MSASTGGLTIPSETASEIDDHQQRPFAVRDLGCGGDVLDGAEEIRRLDDDAGGRFCDRLLQRLHDPPARSPVKPMVVIGTA